MQCRQNSKIPQLFLSLSSFFSRAIAQDVQGESSKLPDGGDREGVGNTGLLEEAPGERLPPGPRLPGKPQPHQFCLSRVD